MNKKTLTALKGSIKKWKGIVAGDRGDEGIIDCPLCILFFERYNPYDYPATCQGCPVAKKTGRNYCSGTPYDKWCNVTSTGSHPWYARTPKQIDIAKEELAFLKSLLPKKKKK